MKDFIRLDMAWQMANRAARELESLAPVNTAIVLPLEALEGVSVASWEGSFDDFDKPFDVALGEAAASFLERELTIEATVSRYIKIAVGGGSTVKAAIDALPASRGQTRDKFKVSPVTIGDVPSPLYSAAVNAACLAQKLTANGVVYLHREVPWSSSGHGCGVALKMSKEVLDARDKVKIQNEFDATSPLFYNVLLTGIGSHGACLDQQLDRWKYPDGDLIKGDICSRPFGADGVEIGHGVSDNFVGVTFDILESLSTIKSPASKVIAVAGGYKKVEPIVCLLRGFGSGRRRFNVLCTDELTARSVIRELKQMKLVSQRMQANPK